MSNALIISLLALAAAGCGGTLDTADTSADTAALAATSGKRDAAPAADPQGSVDGNYVIGSDYGDIWYLYLRGGDGAWSWTRCYDADCAAPVIEAGTYKLSTTRSGRKYITMYQADRLDQDRPRFNSMYAYVKSAHGLKLRRVYTSSWMRFDAVSDADLCASSGGVMTNVCDCGAWPNAWSPGAAGCWLAPAVNEESCDNTHGSWSDDDPNASGTFCDCGYGRALSDSGCVDR